MFNKQLVQLGWREEATFIEMINDDVRYVLDQQA